MTLPKLALIPSGYKVSEVYSVLPTNGDGDFTFSRSGTATRVNKNGLIETVDSNVPRLDYSDSNCPSLLLEPQRTNLVTYSEAFNLYNINGGTINSNDIIAPDGSINADTFVENTSNSQHRIREDISVSAGIYTMSVFVKGTDRYISLYPQGSGNAYAVFDIANETITITGGSDYVDSKIENYENGWYRCILTYNNIAGTNFLHIYLSNSSTQSAPIYTGNNFEISFFGLQLEAGNYATSYIPTEGGAETRTVDKCLNGGDANLFNDSEGTLFIDLENFDATSTQITLSNGYSSNRISFLFYGSTFSFANRIRFYLSSANSPQVDTSYAITYTFNQRNKIAFRYKQNDFKAYINGVEVFSNTSGNTPIGLSRLDFSQENQSSGFIEGKIKDIRVYNTALTDVELQALTTL